MFIKFTLDADVDVVFIIQGDERGVKLHAFLMLDTIRKSIV